MRIFRQRRGTTSTRHPGDDQLLETLATRFGPLEKPRHWVHYLYVADSAAAVNARDRVVSAGWGIQRVDLAAMGPGFVVIAEKDGAVLSPDAVRDARLFFESVAASVPGGDYDGWEASG